MRRGKGMGRRGIDGEEREGDGEEGDRWGGEGRDGRQM